MNATLTLSFGAAGFILGLGGILHVTAAVAPALRIERAENSVAVRFDGNLQVADDPSGPYLAVEGAASPYAVRGEVGPRYWRSVVPEGSSIRSLVAGGTHALVLGSGGTLRGWGLNNVGQLGAGVFSSEAPFGINQPTVTGGGGLPRSWQSVAAGGEHSLAIDAADGSLWAWGFNGYGQLGNGTETGQSLPGPISASASAGAGVAWSRIAAGGNHSLGVRSEGTLWSWGDNRYGQIGNGTFDALSPFGPTHGIPSPVQVGTNSNWTSVAAGPNHSLALAAGGTLWAWGANSGGLLGIGRSSVRVLAPERVINPAPSASWRSVAAGYSHTVAIQTDGSLWAWGSNGEGQISGGTNYATVPVPQNIGTGQRWLAAASGPFHTVALREDGTLWGCGRNDAGQLAQVGTTRVNTLRPIETNSTWCAVVTGERHTIALRSDRTLWAWGDNERGQLGDGTYIGSSEPRRIADTSNW